MDTLKVPIAETMGFRTTTRCIKMTHQVTKMTFLREVKIVLVNHVVYPRSPTARIPWLAVPTVDIVKSLEERYLRPISILSKI